MGAPGSQILPSPGGLSRGGWLGAVFPAWPPAGFQPAGWSGAEARLRLGIQMEDTGGIRIVLAGVPAARPLHRGQRSISVSGLTDPMRHAPAGGGTSAMAIEKTLSAA